MGGWGRRLRLAIQGDDPRTGKRFIWHMFHARPGGGGSIATATAGTAAASGTRPAGLKFGSVEVAEVRFPLLFKSPRVPSLAPAGAGGFVGGVGAVMEMQVETAGPARANTAGDGIRHGARGMAGRARMPRTARLPAGACGRWRRRSELQTKAGRHSGAAGRRLPRPFRRRRRLGPGGEARSGSWMSWSGPWVWCRGCTACHPSIGPSSAAVLEK